MATALEIHTRPHHWSPKPRKSPPLVPHAAVFQSITRGLERLGHPFVLNPPATLKKRPSLVIGGRRTALEQSIFRRCGLNKTTVIGPNFTQTPGSSWLWSQAFSADHYLVPSQWVKEVWAEQAPRIADRITIWPAGIDERYWIPSEERRTLLLVYLKGRDSGSFQSKALENFAKSAKLELRVLAYGTYQQEFYLSLLQRSALMVVKGTTESQGLFLSEAWSCNVPTLVFNNPVYQYNQMNYAASGAPYLSESAGEFFEKDEELIDLAEQFLRNKVTPRDLVMNQLSDKVCTRKLLEILY